MDQSAREDRESHLLRTLARGGLSDQQRVRIEHDLHELQASREREQQWRSLTVARVQPGFRNLDAFER
jgi:hypothetical protein